jgi:hypothetical protein
MRLKLFACIAMAGALMPVARVHATPLFTPFLSVDVNGANYGGGQTVGPTQAGYQSINAFQGFDQLDPGYNPAEDWGTNAPTGLSKTFVTGQGNVTLNLIGVGLNYGARNRGANAGGQSDLYQDFAFAQRDGAIAFGRNYVKVKLSGLAPNTAYEFTGFAREPAFNAANLADPADPGQSFQSWTDLGALGGKDGPAAWMDTSISNGYSYQPAVGGVNNPIPHYGRSQVAGPDALSTADPYFHSLSFATRSDASGAVTVYTWADPNGFGGTVQGASLLNGFQLGVFVPEPTSLAICSVGLIGMLFTRRRVS